MNIINRDTKSHVQSQQMSWHSVAYFSDVVDKISLQILILMVLHYLRFSGTSLLIGFGGRSIWDFTYVLRQLEFPSFMEVYPVVLVNNSVGHKFDFDFAKCRTRYIGLLYITKCRCSLIND